MKSMLKPFLWCVFLFPLATQAGYVSIVPTGAQSTSQSWKYTTTAPATGWNTASFSDGSWSSGTSGFGSSGTPGITVRTQWTSTDIWLRKSFNPGDIGAIRDQLRLCVFHDEDVEVYINGVQAFAATGYVTSYEYHTLSAAARNALISNGTNLLAVHCRQSAGGQGVDVGLGRMESEIGERERLVGPYMDKLRRIVFTKHFDMGGSHYAYTEAVSDATHERNFVAGSALCLLTINDDYTVTVDTLLASVNGVIRDPEVSFDAKKILFAWKKSDRQDDYHLYEMDVESRNVRQITSGLGYADYEGCYLPNGDIVFNSTRCVQYVDCWYTEVSNLFTCDKDGRYMRRLGYDQVHTNYPQLASDGTVTYTRWEYNDRGQLYVQGLFHMYPDGTHQTALYGNNSWFPTTIMHAREIPSSGGKLVAIFAGHHTKQKGKLGIIDPTKGREENSGATLIAPVRQTDAVHVDAYGQDGDQWQYPYPLDGEHFLVTFRPAGASYFGIYFMDIDGNRCMLAEDPGISCNQAVPLAARPVPNMPTGSVDYSKTTGVYTMENVYYGPAMQGVTKGTIKKLRVVALKYRAAAIGNVKQNGPAGGADESSPVGVDNTSWDTKVVLGETPVYSDGSAAFEVPARTPVFFQAIDSNGYVVQTMRSWSTLQPGEKFSCFGCHEDKNEAVPITGISEATRTGAKPLTPLYDVPQDTGFSYSKVIQPIWDNRCTRCHDGSHPKLNLLATPKTWNGGLSSNAQKYWSNSYVKLVWNQQTSGQAVRNSYLNWLSPQSIPSVIPPKSAGSINSPIFAKIKNHSQSTGITQAELAKIACWIDLVVPHEGEYDESYNATDKATYAKGMQKRRNWEKQETLNIQAYIMARQTAVAPQDRWSPPHAAWQAGAQSGARVCVQLGGSRVFLDVPVEKGRRAEAIEVYNASGRLVRTVPLAASGRGGIATAAVSGPLGNGIYFVKAAGASRASATRVAIFGR